MKELLLLCLFIIAISLTANVQGTQQRLGQNRCTWGANYWCHRVAAAKECHAFDFCLNQWKEYKPKYSMKQSTVCNYAHLVISSVKGTKQSENMRMKFGDSSPKKSCNLLTHNNPIFQQMCQSITVDFAEEIKIMIDSGLNVEQIVNLLGFCDEPINVEFKKPSFVEFVPNKIKEKNEINFNQMTNKLVSVIECDVCHAVVKDLQVFANQSITPNDFKNTFKNVVCSRLGKLNKECVQLVNVFGDQLYSLILSEINDIDWCGALKVCHKKSASIPSVKTIPLKKPTHQLGINKNKNIIECEICIHVMNYVDSFLEENSTETEVEKVLEKVCSFLPSSIRNECDSLIEQYTPILIHLFVADFPPRKICQALKMCTASVGNTSPAFITNTSPFIKLQKLNPLPSVKAYCASGPKYWCRSVIRAKGCGPNAVNVCRKFYWNRK